jgi:hypothetical protein
MDGVRRAGGGGEGGCDDDAGDTVVGREVDEGRRGRGGGRLVGFLYVYGHKKVSIGEKKLRKKNIHVVT